MNNGIKKHPEQSNFAKLDSNRTVEISGYYYDADDLNKVHAHFKDGCILVGSEEFNKKLLDCMLNSPDMDDVLNHVQSLHTDAQGEDMLTTWLDIQPLINIFNSIDLAQNLLPILQNWQEMGVTEIYLSWYINPYPY